MSDLETSAAPLLTPMIEGDTTGLDIAQQVTASRWATKTAAVWDELVPEEHRVWTPDARRWIMEQPTPPRETRVRLGHFTGRRPEFIEHQRVALYRELPELQTEAPDAHRTVILLGKLVIVVGAGADDDGLNAPGVELDDILMLIWPTAAARGWPPREGMTDKTLDSLYEPNEPD